MDQPESLGRFRGRRHRIAFMGQHVLEIGAACRAVVHDQDAGPAERAEAGGLPLLPGIAEGRRAPAQERLDPQDDQLLLGGFGDVGVRAALQALALDSTLPGFVSMITGMRACAR